MQKDSNEDRQLLAAWAATPISEKISNAMALGCGLALAAGGGISNLVMMLPCILLTIWLARPTATLVLAGFVMFGHLSPEPNSANVIPALTGAAFCVLCGYLAYLWSKRLVRTIERTAFRRIMWLLPIVYITAYILLTVIFAMVLRTSGAL